MKKKLVSLLLCLTMIFSLGLTACGDGDATQPCLHTFVRETFLEATCISEGVDKETCSKCGRSNYEKTQKIAHSYANGACTVCREPAANATPCSHNYVQETFLEATCISQGVLKKTCSKCHETLYEKTQKSSHSYVNGVCDVCKAVDPTWKNPSNAHRTINVEVFKGSYGADWVYALREKFENVYADQGYKVNILTPTADMRNNVAVQDLARGYNETQVDMYITGGVSSNKVGREGEYGVIAEELSDLWAMKPIGYDGQEESKTLKEKVTAGTMDAFKDNYGETYGVPYIAMTGGMVVNKRKLAMYGINTLPTTTNELFDMWTTIYTGANGMENSEETMIFPFTYIPGGNGYTIDWWQLAMAQYDEALAKEYWSWQTENPDGTVTWWENGVENGANNAFLASLEVMAQAFDVNTMAYGTLTQTLDQAQAQIMKKNQGAIFMCNGSWYLNDMALAYKNSLEDITFINFPVVSALATKLWGTQGKTEAELEAALRYAIACVDDLSKVDDLAVCAGEVTMATGVQVTAEDMAEVRRARYAYSDRTADSQMVITKDTPNADICKLFMRMIASDDGAQTIAEYANGSSAYMTAANTYSEYTFVKDASKIHANNYATAHVNRAKGYRYAVGITQNVVFTNHIPDYIAYLVNPESIYDGNGGMSGKTVQVYKDLAATIVANEAEALTTKFDGWKTQNVDRIEKYRYIFGYNG